MPKTSYLNLNDYRILSGEKPSMIAKNNTVPKSLEHLGNLGLVANIRRNGYVWIWDVTEHGRSEAGISLQEANRQERHSARERELEQRNNGSTLRPTGEDR